MELITRKNRATNVYLRWMEQYPNDKDGIGERLKALGNNPDPDAVDVVIGNRSWTNVSFCSECDGKFDRVAMVGEPLDYESRTAFICENCLEKALILLKG